MRSRALLVFLTAIALIVAVAAVDSEAKQSRQNKKKKKNATATVQVQVLPLFEKGAFEELIAAVDEAQKDGAQVNPDALYLQARSQQKRQATGAARRAYDTLAGGADADAWTYIGKSAAAVLSGELDAAATAVDRAVEIDGHNLYAHLQRGLVRVERKQNDAAAEAFVRVLEIQGDFAYGHYHAAMAYFATRNLVACANHLERFLQLAPEAPERLEAQSILATLRG